MGLFFIPFALFVIIGASNAVNLTDGLDGLATVPVMLTTPLAFAAATVRRTRTTTAFATMKRTASARSMRAAFVMALALFMTAAVRIFQQAIVIVTETSLMRWMCAVVTA